MKDFFELISIKKEELGSLLTKNIAYNEEKSYFVDYSSFLKDGIVFDVLISKNIYHVNVDIMYRLDTGAVTLNCYHYEHKKGTIDKSILLILDEQTEKIRTFVTSFLKLKILKEIPNEKDRIKWITKGKALSLNGEKIETKSFKELETFLKEKADEKDKDKIHSFFEIIEKLKPGHSATCINHPTKRGKKIKNIENIGIVWEGSEKPIQLKTVIINSEWILDKNA